MASWDYNVSKGKRYVRVRARDESGKIRPLPRSLISHLDGQPRHIIQSWVDNYALTVEARMPGVYVVQDPALRELFRRFDVYMRARKDASTCDGYRKALLDRVFPFLLARPEPLTNPEAWVHAAPRLLEYLEAKKVSVENILRANTAFKKFWAWLIEDGVLPVTMPDLRLRRPVRPTKTTPLKFTLNPDQVLAWCKKCPDPELKFMALMGYFCSLRPYETFGLTKAFFAAGKAAQDLECCKTMAQMQMFDRLAVYVARNRRARKRRVEVEKFKKPKTSASKAWVACFNEDAAKEIVKLVNKFPKDWDTFFQYAPRKCQEKWQENGMRGYSLKDLRRASAYWLGHNTEFSKHPILFQKHTRHKKMDTALLYLRRPEETTAEDDLLDLGA